MDLKTIHRPIRPLFDLYTFSIHTPIYLELELKITKRPGQLGLVLHTNSFDRVHLHQISNTYNAFIRNSNLNVNNSSKPLIACNQAFNTRTYKQYIDPLDLHSTHTDLQYLNHSPFDSNSNQQKDPLTLSPPHTRTH